MSAWEDFIESCRRENSTTYKTVGRMERNDGGTEKEMMVYGRKEAMKGMPEQEWGWRNFQHGEGKVWIEKWQ
jgi:hypothetical protein